MCLWTIIIINIGMFVLFSGESACYVDYYLNTLDYGHKENQVKSNAFYVSFYPANPNNT